MPRRAQAFVLSVVFWQLACVASLIAFSRTLTPFVTWIYEGWWGSIQNSYGCFERLVVYLQIIVGTTLATLVSLRAFDLICRQRVNWVLVRRVFYSWQIIVIGLLIGSHEFSFAYKLNQLVWTVRGPPDNIYSFTNLVLPRILAWLCCTVPVSWVGLRFYSNLTTRPTKGFPVV
jgi:hypothetical protein